MSTEDKFECHDIHLAAFLVVAGCKYEGKRQEGRRVFFIFTNPGGSIQDLKEAYFSNTGMVPAHRYAQELQRFKSLCFVGN